MIRLHAYEIEVPGFTHSKDMTLGVSE